MCGHFIYNRLQAFSSGVSAVWGIHTYIHTYIYAYYISFRVVRIRLFAYVYLSFANELLKHIPRSNIHTLPLGRRQNFNCHNTDIDDEERKSWRAADEKPFKLEPVCLALGQKQICRAPKSEELPKIPNTKHQLPDWQDIAGPGL